MITIKFRGTIDSIGEVKGGVSQKTGKEWKMVDVIFDVPEGRYSDKIIMTASNEVVDEVLDSSLDEEGINMAMNLFRSFKDSNIFVISHRETIQDSRFDKIIKVKKERQFSVIEDD